MAIGPGLEFDPTRKYRYGLHSLAAAVLIFIAFIIIELRSCSGGPGIDLETLQSLHLIIMVSALILYLLSLFGIADYIFQCKIMFFTGLLIISVIIGLMAWSSYEAAVNPCVASINGIPVDFSSYEENVFSRNDLLGIVILMLNIFSTLFLISAAFSFYMRY